MRTMYFWFLLIMVISTKLPGQSTNVLSIKDFVKKTDSDQGLIKIQSLDYRHPIFDSIKVNNGNIVPLFDSQGLRKVIIFSIRDSVKEESHFYYDAGKLIYYDCLIVECKQISTLEYRLGSTLQGSRLFFNNQVILGYETFVNDSWSETKLTDEERHEKEKDIMRMAQLLKVGLKNN